MESHFGWRSCVSDDGWRKGPWTPQEDKLLTEHVHLQGEGRWNFVSRLTGLKRSGKSCRLRWVNYLRPDLKRGKITPNEETIILDLHARWGNRWSTIAKSLPGRTDNEIKNYWRTHFKKGKSSKNIERIRAHFLRQQQEQKKLQFQQSNEPKQQQVQEVATAKWTNMPLEVHAAEMYQDIQDLTYMFPMSYMLLQENENAGSSTREEGSFEDQIPNAWENIWDLDDRDLYY